MRNQPVPKISVVVATKNEEQNIAACLETVRWADEIIVVDMESTDKTREIAKRLRAQVFISDGGPNNLIPYNKNIGFKKASGEWILVVDADERVSKKLREEMKEVAKNTDYSAFSISIPTYFWGKWIIYGWEQDQVRLFKKSKTKGYVQNIPHDRLEIDGKIGKLEGQIYHLGYRTIEQFIAKMNLYTTQHAHSQFLSGAEKVAWPIFFKDPIANFYYQYFKLRGYKHGMHGFMMCLLMSVYCFVERAKLWELQAKNDYDELHKYDGQF